MYIYNCLKRTKDIIRKQRRILSTRKYGLMELENITCTLNNNNVHSFADFGTLLGLIRNRYLLKGDDDIDIGVVLDSDKTISSVSRIIRSKGFELSREFTINEEIKQQSYEKKHLRVDIHYYFLDDSDLMYCHLFYKSDKNARNSKWRSVIKKCPVIDNLKQLVINGYRVYVPDRADNILEYKYGDDWKIPNNKWKYWEGPNTYPIDSLGVLKTWRC